MMDLKQPSCLTYPGPQQKKRKEFNIPQAHFQKSQSKRKKMDHKSKNNNAKYSWGLFE